MGNGNWAMTKVSMRSICGEPQAFVGVLHQGRIFKLLKSFPLDKPVEAQQRLRQLSIDATNTYILLAEEDRFSIWVADSKLKLWND